MNMKLFWILGANPDIVPNGSRVPWARRARSSSEHQVPSGRLRRSVRSQTAVHPLARRIARTGGVLSLHMGRRYAKIMARKQASELARVKLFARYGKRIVQTAKAGGDVDAIVREAIERGVPKENVARALTKASASEQANFESAIYELFGPHGVGILVEALTDNLNRTAAEVRLVARKAGLQMASAGAVQHLFERKGCIRAFVSEEDAESSQFDPDSLLLIVADAGADDLQHLAMDDTPMGRSEFLVWTPPGALAQVAQALTTAGVKLSTSELVMVPKLIPPPVSEADRDLIHAGVEALQAIDDVDQVYTTLDPRPCDADTSSS